MDCTEYAIAQEMRVPEAMMIEDEAGGLPHGAAKDFKRHLNETLKRRGMRQVVKPHGWGGMRVVGQEQMGTDEWRERNGKDKRRCL